MKLLYFVKNYAYNLLLFFMLITRWNFSSMTIVTLCFVTETVRILIRSNSNVRLVQIAAFLLRGLLC